MSSLDWKNKLQSKKKRFIILSCILIVLFLITFIVFILTGRDYDIATSYSTDKSTIDRQENNAIDRIEIIEGLKLTLDYRLEDIPNPFYRILEDPEEARERYQLWSVNAVLKNEKSETYPTINFYDYKEQIAYINDRAPLDTPRLLILFRKPGPDGNMIPCLVKSVSFRPLIVEKGLMEYRPGGIYHREHGQVDPGGFKSKIYSDYLDYGGIREFDPDVHGPYVNEGGYGISVLLSESAPLEYASLIAGSVYGVSIGIRSEDGETEISHFILRTPENIPKGKTAVFEVDVTEEQNYRELLSRKASERSRARQINFYLNYNRYKPYRYLMWCQVESSYRGPVEYMKIMPDGKTTGGVDELGGRLIVGVIAPERQISYMIFYIDKLKSRDISLPRDADIVVNTQHLVNFQLKVPYDKLPEEAFGLRLLIDKESQLTVASGRFGSLHGIDPELEEGYQPESIPMKSLPGEYYVTYSGRRISLAARSHDASRVIGRVVISKEDEGKTLQVLPLE